MQTTIKTLNENIHKEAHTTLGYVVLFLLYYIFLILVGIAFFCIAAVLTFLLVEGILSVGRISIRGLIGCIVLVLAMWWFCIQVAWHLIKPLFQIHKPNRKGYFEVKREDSPELFALIDEVTKETNNEMPKHVYLSAEMNAGVFYNSTSIWSIFFPTRKNLVIGVALLYGLSRAELKSILSHEFGHFAQGSMRVGTVTYRLLLIIRDMISHAQQELHNAEKNRDEDGSISWFHIASRFIARITNSMITLYHKVERKNCSLSRYMEFEADAVACNNVGSDVFASGLIKIHAMDNTYNIYQNMVSTILQEEKVVKDFWFAYQTAKKIISKDENVVFDYATQLTTPIGDSTRYVSKIKILDGWNTHPSLEDRLAFARELACECVSSELVDAASIVPLEKQNAVGTLYQQIVFESMESKLLWSQLNVMDNEQVTTYITEKLTTHRIPHHIYPFTQNYLQTFDYINVSAESLVESPFTQKSRDLVLEFQQAITDYRTICNLINSNDKFDITYEGKIVDDVKTTYQTHQEYLTQLQERVTEVDKQIYLYLIQSTQDKEKIDSIYWEIFNGRDIRKKWSKLFDTAQEIKSSTDYYASVGQYNLELKPEIEQQLIDDFEDLLKTLPFDKLLSICNDWTAGTLSIEKILQKWEKWAQQSPSQNPKIVWEITMLDDILNNVYQEGDNKLTAQIVEAYSKD